MSRSCNLILQRLEDVLVFRSKDPEPCRGTGDRGLDFRVWRHRAVHAIWCTRCALLSKHSAPTAQGKERTKCNSLPVGARLETRMGALGATQSLQDARLDPRPFLSQMM